MNPKRALATLVCFAMLAQAADLAGEYCTEGNQQTKDMIKQIEQMNKSQIGTKELTKLMTEMSSSTECYQFQANNKVTYVKKAYNATVAYSGSYTQKGNSVSIALDKGDANQLQAFNKKFSTKMILEGTILKYCYEAINNYETVRWKYTGIKKYPQTQQGFDNCVKERDNDRDINMIKAAINMEKSSDDEVKKDLNGFSGNFSIVGNSLHKTDKNCNSTIAYTKKGTKASPLVPFDEDNQFCLNGTSYDKCEGKSYDPTEYKCEKNILLTKCRDGWYNPVEQYCAKDDIKNKDLMDDPRDGKKYHTVKIGSQTWMSENLNYAGEKDDMGECEEKKPENCEKYGSLYSWREAIKICPSGWHLPSNKEWAALINFAGGDEIAGKKLKTKAGWAEKKCKYKTEETTGRGNVIVTEHDNCATDEFGFSALPNSKGEFGRWLSFTEGEDSYAANYAYSWIMDYSEEEVGWDKYEKDRRLSYVRCLQDTEESKKADLETAKAMEEKINLVKSLSKYIDGNYTWQEAKKLCASKGWRLPTIKEAKIIEEFLKKRGVWDEFALPGERWWSATENKDKAYSWGTDGDLDQKTYQWHVRCIMNNSSVPNESPKGSNASSESSSVSNENSNSSTKVSNSSSENPPDLFPWLYNILANSGIKWGLKIAYNASTVFFEGTNSELGHGAEAGIIANIPIPNTSFEISIGANGIYRKPNNKEYIDESEQNVRSELTEYAGSVPIILKYNISSFYAQAGAQVDVPLKKEQKTTKGTEVTWEECPWRNSYDLGVVLGLGWNISKNFALDAKAVGGATEYNKEIGGYKLVQGSAGLNYFF